MWRGDMDKSRFEWCKSGARETAMGETGTSRFLGNLDPSAQEFRPRNPYIQNQMSLSVPTQIYYPYTHPHPQFVASSAYVRPVAGKPPLSPLMSPLSATPTRALLLSSVPTDVSEVTVRENWRPLERHAQACLTEVREQHMQQQSRLKKHYDSLLTRKLASQVEHLLAPLPPPARGLIAGRAVWAQFMIPVSTCTLDDYNQGTLVIFNLDSEVSTSSLRDIFETFGRANAFLSRGSIKELRETPLKRHQRFVEFFDIRDAARALREMNGKKIQGKRVVIEFSRPGGHGWRFFNAISTTALSSTYSTTNSTVISPSRLAYHTVTSRCPPALPCKLPEKSSHFNVPPHSYLSQTHHSTKKSNVVVNGIEDSKGVPRWNPKKSPNGSSTTEQQQQQAQRNRPWKGRQKNIDSCFLINEDAKTESHYRDSRTTVMIKNIPNKYSQKLLMNMLDNHCIDCNKQVPDGGDQPLSSYDFIYLPIDFK
ncbi:Protein terminal ear1 [Vitis vinifera]|uniref:Protein terminal ear1 n=1 Tax=Vitis vinifera TaxID=29760 RepID=A0A438J5P8_VITVI|nr:Protein terminal ear1 [Vitis vinifera]